MIFWWFAFNVSTKLNTCSILTFRSATVNFCWTEMFSHVPASSSSNSRFFTSTWPNFIWFPSTKTRTKPRATSGGGSWFRPRSSFLKMTKTVYKQQFDVAFHRVRCITSSFHEEIYTECSWLARHIFLVNRAKIAKNKVRNAECNNCKTSFTISCYTPSIYYLVSMYCTLYEYA